MHNSNNVATPQAPRMNWLQRLIAGWVDGWVQMAAERGEHDRDA